MVTQTLVVYIFLRATSYPPSPCWSQWAILVTVVVLMPVFFATSRYVCPSSRSWAAKSLFAISFNSSMVQISRRRASISCSSCMRASADPSVFIFFVFHVGIGFLCVIAIIQVYHILCIVKDMIGFDHFLVIARLREIFDIRIYVCWYYGCYSWQSGNIVVWCRWIFLPYKERKKQWSHPKLYMLYPTKTRER